MSSKIVGLLVRARDDKILQLGIKSRINKNPGMHPVSLVHMFFRNFQEILSYSNIQELVL